MQQMTLNYVLRQRRQKASVLEKGLTQNWWNIQNMNVLLTLSIVAHVNIITLVCSQIQMPSDAFAANDIRKPGEARCVCETLCP